MCLWDISDGRCVENTKMPHIHTCMQVRYSDIIFPNQDF